MSDFGLRDLRAKGATDEYRAVDPSASCNICSVTRMCARRRPAWRSWYRRPCAGTNDRWSRGRN